MLVAMYSVRHISERTAGLHRSFIKPKGFNSVAQDSFRILGFDFECEEPIEKVMCAPAPGVKASEAGAGLAAGLPTSGAAVATAAASCLTVFPGASLGSAGSASDISDAPDLAAAAFAGLLLPLAIAGAGSFCCFRGDFFAAGLGSGDASEVHAEAEVTRGSIPDGKQHRCCSFEGVSIWGACGFLPAAH